MIILHAVYTCLSRRTDRNIWLADVQLRVINIIIDVYISIGFHYLIPITKSVIQSSADEWYIVIINLRVQI